MSPQATVLTSGARIGTQNQQSNVIGSTTSRIGASQPSVTIGRLSVAATPAQVSNSNIVAGQTRTLNIQSLVAVANASQSRQPAMNAQPSKVIGQPAQGKVVTMSL